MIYVVIALSGFSIGIMLEILTRDWRKHRKGWKDIDESST